MTQAIASRIAADLALEPRRVGAAVSLLEDGNTVPFLARYRKEATGGLDEEQLRRIGERLGELRALDERRATVIASIEEQGLLTPALRARIEAAATRTELEDLYLPFKPKRRTRAGMARERGLEALAGLILAQGPGGAPPLERARAFLGPDVATPEDALAGARDIVAETIADDPDVRRATREKALRFGRLVAVKTKGAGELDPREVFKTYSAFSQRVDRVLAYQTLALDRGEKEKVLRVGLEVEEKDWRGAVAARFRPSPRSPFAGELELAIADAAERLLLPAIERDVRRELTEAAETHAIGVFGSNLRGLLGQPPLAGRTVVGLDPGFRTGCKAAVVDPTGKVLETATIHPHEPQKRWGEALDALQSLVRRHGATLVAIGNGTASRETEKLAAELCRREPGARYLIVSEAGASVYSASPLARAELPDLDVSLRGAVSIARRAQDPLAELVKIDPQSIGVGLYQHDVDAARLASALGGVVESVVNRVGVDVNTASPALLGYVAGIGPKLAERIVAHRDGRGPFASRAAIREVSGLGPKAFEQAAGFLRVRGGSEPLDATAIHPESYATARKALARAGLAASAAAAERAARLSPLREREPLRALAAELGAGEPTLADILEQLVRPGRDPREDLPPPILRSDVLSLDDLKPGQRLKGTVRNVVDFGAFVDIGVKHDGLLHRSQVPGGTALGVGDVIEVEIQKVEAERGRIALAWPRG